MKYRVGARRKAVEYEKAVAEWWKLNKTFEQSVNFRPEDKSYVFYDGPPFITGLPHHGTLLSSIVKDAIPRYYTMQGYRVERRWGWDCHGLPAENFVEQQLGIKDRREIGSKWSLEDYIIKARESMVANSELWRGTIDRVGRWVDFDHAYRTMNKDYMESVWWAFKQLYDAGLIYEGRKVLMYDTKFATPVSKAEVNMDNDAYQTVTDPSAYVKFEIENKQNTYLLAWTTTPWTLPANLCLAVNPDLEYGLYDDHGDKLIVAKNRAKVIFPDQKPEKTFKGKDLVGLKYRPIIDAPEALFDQTPQKPQNSANNSTKPLKKSQNQTNDPAEAPKNLRSDTYTVLPAVFVSAEDGTGIVHIAPAYGEDDYALYEKYDLDFLDCLDDNGYYLPEMAKTLHALGLKDTDENGIQVWAGNKFLAKVLEEQGIVYNIEYIRHDYPFNPRSKTRIIYRAFPSWFFDIQDQKPLMLAQNEHINWFPPYLKHGRFQNNIEQAPDWNLSRDRFWATAMPVWKGDQGTTIVVGSYEELEKLSGQTLDDYHRPWVDQIEFDINGEHFTRIEKVLDCWFESGSMPFAELHYPFENKAKFEKNYPADFIVEYVGQVRAWFYYLHAVNTSLAEIGAFGKKAKKGHKNAFKNVITTGTLAGNDGRKMSKSLGNYTDPNELMDQFSADSLRLLLLSSPVLSGEDFSLTDKDVSDVNRKLAMIWNVFDFFTTYAAIDGIDSDELESLTHAAATETTLVYDPENPLDRWILSRLHDLQSEIETGMAAYNLPKALDGVLPFIDDLSNWFVRRSRRRFSKNDDPADKRGAYATLYFVLIHLSKILAPFVPFLAEELFHQMLEGGFSTPVLRSSSRASFGPNSSSDDQPLQNAPFVSPLSVHLQNWPALPIRDEKVLEAMSRTRQIITDALALRMQKSETEQQIKVRQPLSELIYPGEKLPKFYEQIIADEVNVKKVKHGPELALDKTITPELEREGLARDLIRAIQSARKHAGLSQGDRIRLSLSCDLPEGFADLVISEVLADSFEKNANYAHDEIAKVSGQNITISLEKL